MKISTFIPGFSAYDLTRSVSQTRASFGSDLKIKKWGQKRINPRDHTCFLAASEILGRSILTKFGSELPTAGNEMLELKMKHDETETEDQGC